MGRFIHSCGVAWGSAMTVLAIEGWVMLAYAITRYSKKPDEDKPEEST